MCLILFVTFDARLLRVLREARVLRNANNWTTRKRSDFIGELTRGGCRLLMD
jgi:hypothetical protein